MDGYKPNSNKEKEEKTKIEKVTSGSVKKKEKSDIKKFVDNFIQGDVKEIKAYLLFDVIVPWLKKGFLDTLNKGASMLLNGKAEARSSGDTKIARVSYSKYYDEREPRPWSSRTKRYDYDDIVYSSYEDAETVLNAMADVLGRYRFVKVADLFDLSGITPNPTDYNYGWTDIKSASISQVSEGFVVNLPRPMPID